MTISSFAQNLHYSFLQMGAFQDKGLLNSPPSNFQQSCQAYYRLVTDEYNPPVTSNRLHFEEGAPRNPSLRNQFRFSNIDPNDNGNPRFYKDPLTGQSNGILITDVDRAGYTILSEQLRDSCLWLHEILDSKEQPWASPSEHALFTIEALEGIVSLLKQLASHPVTVEQLEHTFLQKSLMSYVLPSIDQGFSSLVDLTQNTQTKFETTVALPFSDLLQEIESLDQVGLYIKFEPLRSYWIRHYGQSLAKNFYVKIDDNNTSVSSTHSAPLLGISSRIWQEVRDMQKHEEQASGEIAIPHIDCMANALEELTQLARAYNLSTSPLHLGHILSFLKLLLGSRGQLLLFYAEGLSNTAKRGEIPPSEFDGFHQALVKLHQSLSSLNTIFSEHLDDHEKELMVDSQLILLTSIARLQEAAHDHAPGTITQTVPFTDAEQALMKVRDHYLKIGLLQAAAAELDDQQQIDISDFIEFGQGIAQATQDFLEIANQNPQKTNDTFTTDLLIHFLAYEGITMMEAVLTAAHEANARSLGVLILEPKYREPLDAFQKNILAIKKHLEPHSIASEFEDLATILQALLAPSWGMGWGTPIQE